MDKNAYAKGWWDAMAIKRDPKGQAYTWSPPSIPVSEISRILVNYRKNVINKRLGLRKTLILRVIEDIRRELELRRRSRVQKNIRGICQVDSSTKQSDVSVRHIRGSACRHEERCTASTGGHSKRERSGSTRSNNARSSSHKALKNNSH